MATKIKYTAQVTLIYSRVVVIRAEIEYTYDYCGITGLYSNKVKKALILCTLSLMKKVLIPTHTLLYNNLTWVGITEEAFRYISRTQ